MEMVFEFIESILIHKKNNMIFVRKVHTGAVAGHFPHHLERVVMYFSECHYGNYISPYDILADNC